MDYLSWASLTVRSHRSKTKSRRAAGEEEHRDDDRELPCWRRRRRCAVIAVPLLPTLGDGDGSSDDVTQGN